MNKQPLTSPKPIEGGLRWVKAVDRMPGLHKEVKWRSDLLDIPDQPMWMEAVLHNYGHVQSSLEWLDEGSNTGEWVSCDNKLPDSEGRYLCGYKSVSSINDFPFIQFVSNFLFYRDRESGKRCERETNETGCFQDDNGYASAVTHWQPLPEPPKQ